MSEKSFGNDLGSASTCCAMDVECKGSELEPWGKAPSFWWKVYLSLQKKWPSEFALSPRIYVMGFCKASILRDVHSHERHWIFPFLVFRLRLVRLALVADIHSCSRSTSFGDTRVLPKMWFLYIFLFGLFIDFQHNMSMFWLICTWEYRCVEWWSSWAATPSSVYRIKTDHNQHRAQVWLICKLKLTGSLIWLWSLYWGRMSKSMFMPRAPVIWSEE